MKPANHKNQTMKVFRLNALFRHYPSLCPPRACVLSFKPEEKEEKEVQKKEERHSLSGPQTMSNSVWLSAGSR
jgi:hypothetical protein